MLRRVIFAAALALATPSVAFAAAEGKHPPPVDWSFDGPFGTFDQAAVQRGFQVYKEVCSACHSMRHLSYRNLGEPGGPFVANGKLNRATGAWEDVKLGPPHHGSKLVPAGDNPYVRAIAAEYKVKELDRSTGEMVERPARPADRFVSPFENVFQARAVHGVAPPDLSVITAARKNGPDYIHAVLIGYADPPPGKSAPGGAPLNYNPYFPGGWIAMPPPLPPDRVTYADGTAATPDQMSRDVVTFLQWAYEPKQIERKRTGFAVLFYLAVLTALLYAAYRQVWRNVKH